jgi:hypothetical protein
VDVLQDEEDEEAEEMQSKAEYGVGRRGRREQRFI